MTNNNHRDTLEITNFTSFEIWIELFRLTRKMNSRGSGVNLLCMFMLNPVLNRFKHTHRKLNFGGVLRIQSLPLLIQVNHSKYLYQWNTGNGTTYILYQRTTARDVTECEWGKTKSAPTLQRRLENVWLDQSWESPSSTCVR